MLRAAELPPEQYIEVTYMRSAFCGSLLALVSCAGLVMAQSAEKPAPSVNQVPPVNGVPPVNAVPPVNPILCPYGTPDYVDHGAHGPDVLGGPGCGSGCTGGACPRDFLWAEAEYLAWWIKDGPVAAPLVTTGSVLDPVPGALGQPNTAVLFGNRDIDFKVFSGVRFSAGFWATADHVLGFEGSGFVLETRTERFTATSDLAGRPVIALPFTNALTLMPDISAVAIPGLLTGAVAINATSRLWGAEGNARSCVYRDGNQGFDILAGFRYADLAEDLTIAHSSTTLPGSNLIFNNMLLRNGGNVVNGIDSFETHNRFYGGQLGAQAEYRWGQAFVSVLGKVALGNNHEEVTIAGSSSVVPAGGARVPAGTGLFATSSNAGSFDRDEFAVIPELRLRLGYQFNHYVSAYVGYTIMYWSDVVRPGIEIDPVINPTLISSNPLFGQAIGPPRPAPFFKTTDFWAQGVDFGIALSF
jgi:hypothetical protein